MRRATAANGPPPFDCLEEVESEEGKAMRWLVAQLGHLHHSIVRSGTRMLVWAVHALVAQCVCSHTSSVWVGQVQLSRDGTLVAVFPTSDVGQGGPL